MLKMYAPQLVLPLAVFVAGDFVSSSDAGPLPTSPVFYPSPWSAGGPDGWDDAYQRAHEFGQYTRISSCLLSICLRL